MTLDDDPILRKKLNKVVKDLENLSNKDLPELIRRYWKKVGPDVAKVFIKKNYRLWSKLWNQGIQTSYESGIKKTSYATVFKEPGIVRELADDYFDDHGMELVKTLTESDMLKLKGQMKKNWGLGEDEFARRYKDSYTVSPDRIKTIFRTEHHTAMNNAVLDVSKRLGREYKEWVVLNDERTCPICAQHIGDVVPIDKPFVSINKKGEEIEHDIPQDAHPQCYSSDTEVLTESGWKLFKNVDKSELIWTLTTCGKPRLDTIKNTISYKMGGTMINITGKNIDLLVTPNHEVVVLDYDGYCFKKILSVDVSINSHIPTSRENPLIAEIPNKVEVVTYDDIVYCLEMEKNPILFVRRNGKTAWCGNCRCTLITLREKDLTEEHKAKLIEKGYMEPEPEVESTDGEMWTPRSEYVSPVEEEYVPSTEYVELNERGQQKLNYKCPKGSHDEGFGCGGEGNSGITIDRVHRDNPGGNWLSGEREYASKQYSEKGRKFAGSVTATFDGRLPTKMLASLPGVNKEHMNKNILNDFKAEPIRESIKNEGVKEAVMLYVGFNGNVAIAEGNHRVHLANEFGIKDVPVDIRYFAGGELASGNFKLSNFEKETDQKHLDMEKQITSEKLGNNDNEEPIEEPKVYDTEKMSDEEFFESIKNDDELAKLRRKYKLLKKKSDDIKLNYKCPKGTVDESNKCGSKESGKVLDAQNSREIFNSDPKITNVINELTGYSFDVNRFLAFGKHGEYTKDKNKKEAENSIRVLDDIFKDPRAVLSEDTIIFRGMQGPTWEDAKQITNGAIMEEGSVLEYKPFMFATGDEKVARRYASGWGKTDDTGFYNLVHIAAPKGTKALYLPFIEYTHKGEDEYILNRNVRVHVSKIKEHAFKDENGVKHKIRESYWNILQDDSDDLMEHKAQSSKNPKKSGWPKFNESKSNDGVIASGFLKLNYKCPKGTVDESNACGNKIEAKSENKQKSFSRPINILEQFKSHNIKTGVTDRKYGGNFSYKLDETGKISTSILMSEDLFNEDKLDELMSGNKQWSESHLEPFTVASMFQDKEKYVEALCQHEIGHSKLFNYLVKQTKNPVINIEGIKPILNPGLVDAVDNGDNKFKDIIKSAQKDGWEPPSYYSKRDYGEMFAEFYCAYKCGYEDMCPPGVVEYIKEVESSD